MKKTKENLTAIGFPEEEKLGVFRYRGFLDDCEPFEKKGKLGVRRKDNKNILLEAEFTYLEVFLISHDVFLTVGKEGRYGLYALDYDEVQEVIPVEYHKIVRISDNPRIFCAYTDVEKNQYDVYWMKGVLAKGCMDCFVSDYFVKVRYIDERQELFYFHADYYFDVIIGIGRYDIQLRNGYIVVDDGKPRVYNLSGYKVSEDVSGSYVVYSGYLIHITDTAKTFYDSEGKEVNLHERYEDVVETDEYVIAKHKGHWRILYSI